MYTNVVKISKSSKIQAVEFIHADAFILGSNAGGGTTGGIESEVSIVTAGVVAASEELFSALSAAAGASLCIKNIINCLNFNTIVLNNKI